MSGKVPGIKLSLILISIELDLAVATRELESLYDLWFKDYVVGYSILDLARQLQCEENKIIQSIQLVEANGLITTHYPSKMVKGLPNLN